MLEATIKCHGEAGTGKTQLFQAVEKTLKANPVFDERLRVVCKSQQPGQPEAVEVIFKREGKGQVLKSTWS